jgi:hypothetical protein
MDRKSFTIGSLGLLGSSSALATILSMPDAMYNDMGIYQKVWNTVFSETAVVGVLSGFKPDPPRSSVLITVTVTIENFREVLRENEDVFWIMHDDFTITDIVKYCFPKTLKLKDIKNLV